MVAALAVGLSLRWLLVPASPAPGDAGVMPMVVVLAMAGAAATGVLWRRWPRWGKVVAVILVLGWLQAAVRA